jgi:cardiolipin synthase (CMP-forming)
VSQTPPSAPSTEGLGPYFTVPNLISVVRLACIPWFVYLLFGADDRVGAAVLLAVLGATDWVDGWIARRYDQVSEIGKILDPTADRLLFLVAITSMIIDGSVPVLFAVAVLVREAAFAVGAVVLGALGARRIDVTWWGKTATFGLMFAFPLFLVGSADVAGADLWWALGWLTGIPSLVVSYYTFFEYIPLARTALAQGRAARHA